MQEEGSDIIILFISSALLIFIILVIVFVFVMAYQKKMVSQRIEIQQSKLKHQQDLLKASVEVQEKERKRIASDLHDDVGSLLSALRLNVNYLKTIEHIGDAEQEFLSQTTTMLDDGLKNVRRISYDLMPPTLKRYGFYRALGELVERLNESHQIKFKLDIKQVKDIKLKENVELALFRVMQELIANTLHHSSASVVNITIKEGTNLTITYTDDGNGITDETQLKGLGMVNMHSRIKSIDGEIDIAGTDKSHFFCSIVVPIAN